MYVFKVNLSNKITRLYLLEAQILLYHQNVLSLQIIKEVKLDVLRINLKWYDLGWESDSKINYKKKI